MALECCGEEPAKAGRATEVAALDDLDQHRAAVIEPRPAAVLAGGQWLSRSAGAAAAGTRGTAKRPALIVMPCIRRKQGREAAVLGAFLVHPDLSLPLINAGGNLLEAIGAETGSALDVAPGAEILQRGACVVDRKIHGLLDPVARDSITGFVGASLLARNRRAYPCGAAFRIHRNTAMNDDTPRISATMNEV